MGLLPKITITVENTPVMRAVLHRVRDAVFYKVEDRSVDERIALENIAAAIDVALQPEQLTDNDQRSHKEIDHDDRYRRRR